MRVNRLFVLQEIAISICVLFPLGEGVIVVDISTIATLVASPRLYWAGKNYGKANAIDGNPSTSPDTCDCCYSSENNPRPFFTANLNVPTYVDLIKIRGRTDKTDPKSNLDSITVYVDSMPAVVTFSNNNANAEIKPSSIPITNITIVREKPSTATGGWFLLICELQIFVAKCDIGSYGYQCSRYCHCADRQPCNKLNGSCQTPGCAAGWTGSACEIECPQGFYGLSCTHNCGHCLPGGTCNSATGVCDGGCVTGFKPLLCDECLRGRFGISLTDKCCHCLDDTYDRTIGACNGPCEKGLNKILCKECIIGLFGDQCTRQCHCADGKACIKLNGTCQTQGCAAGWKGNSCEIKCTNGTFGKDCIFQSHCLNGTDSNTDTGVCTIGLCDPGWQTNNCSVVCNHGQFGINCSQSCHCNTDADCANANGTCPKHSPLCAAGWMGNACDKECTNGTFGKDCIFQSHCLNGTDSNTETGVCTIGSCDPGWQTNNCSVVCNHGQFGINCSQSCHCNNDADCANDNGTCPKHSPLCAAGWTGNACDKECTRGLFGHDCNYTSHCVNGSRNRPDTGICDEGTCDPGWQMDNCSIECDPKRFGMNCSQQCHCRNDCEHVGGSCLQGLQGEPLCEDDWEGNSCESKKSKQSSSSVATAAAVGSSVAVVVIVVAVIAFFLRRRHLSKNAKAADARLQFSEIQNNKADLPQNVPEVSNQQQEGNLNDGYKGDDNAYYSFSPVKSEIKLHQIWHYVRRKQLKQCKEFDEEFAKLPYGLVKPYDVSQLPENKGKSRYRAMYAYDHSRVILEITGKEQTDFINATIVHGYEKHGKFIASQGPTDNMVKDFWRMVWQKNISKIIMVTNCMEAGGQKCIQYWPDEGSVEQYDDVTVHLEQTDEQRDYVRRQLKIQMEDEPDRIVVQFHFKAWPDKDVPDSTWCLVNFWKAVNHEYDAEEAPIVVHCSAGIGRTGTYIAIDYLHNQAQLEGVVRPLQAVLALREQRVNMVQTKEQYAFLHEAVADMIGMGTHFIWSSQFEAVYNHLMESDPSSKKTRLATQFELLCASLKDNEYAAQEEEDTYANANVARELDTYRPKARKRGSKYLQEIDAMFIPSYSGAKTFIVAKSPTEGSLAGFWSLVQDENVKTIISMCDTSARNYKTCCELGSGSGSVNDLFVVDTVSTTKQRSHVARSFVFHEHGQTNDDDLTTVKVFDYTAWKSGYETPKDALSVLELVDAVTAWQPHLSESQPILLHCSTGSKRCGVLCLVLNELHRLKREDGQVNILDSLMKMKQRNGNMIENAEQYQFCHDVILMHLRKQDNVYANV